MRRLAVLLILLLLLTALAQPQDRLRGGARLRGGPRFRTTATFPVNGIIDNFNRTNEGPPPSSSWTTDFFFFSSSALNGFRVVSNAMVKDTTGAQFNGYWNATDYGPDVEAYITVTDATGINEIAICARLVQIGSGTTDGYCAWSGFGNARIYESNNSSTSFVNSCTSCDTIASGNKYAIEIIGSTIKMWKYSGGSWSTVLTGTDSTISSAGKIGVFADMGSSAILDDLGGGTR